MYGRRRVQQAGRLAEVRVRKSTGQYSAKARLRANKKCIRPKIQNNRLIFGFSEQPNRARAVQS